MSTYTFHCGIDISKDKFDVCLLTASDTHQAAFANTPAGFKQLLDWLGQDRAPEVHCCLEATGKYGNALAAFLHDNRLPVSLVNPLAVHHFAKSELNRNKTDCHDAWIIARYALKQEPRLWRPRSARLQQLHDWVRAREQLVETKVTARLRLSDSSKETAPLFKAQLRLLEKQIQAVEDQIHSFKETEDELGCALGLLTSIPGIGEVTAATVLSTMPEVGEIGGARQLAAFAGLTPRQHQSGRWAGKTRLSKLGHGRLRKALYLPAVSALRCNPRISEMAARMLHKGKKKMVIIGAAMRMLLHICYGVLKNKTPFDPNHLQAAKPVKMSNRAGCEPNSSRPVAVK